MIDNPDSEWKNNYLIYLKCNLEKIMLKLQIFGISYTEFHEPDLNDKVTAIAVLNNGNMFKRLKLIEG